MPVDGQFYAVNDVMVGRVGEHGHVDRESNHLFCRRPPPADRGHTRGLQSPLVQVRREDLRELIDDLSVKLKSERLRRQLISWSRNSLMIFAA